MTRLFGPQYAAIYDSLYQSKDYDREVNCIEDVLRRQQTFWPCSILDLGCGTGGHAIPLARRGHDVMGIDRSTEMLVQALSKSRSAGALVRLNFQEADIRYLNLHKQFNAVVMMFTVLGYQVGDNDVSAVLSSVYRHLANGGIFIFDVWNGLAVLEQGLSERTLEVCREGERVFRHSSARVIDKERQLCDVYFDIKRSVEGREDAWSEIHTLRYFFPQELATLLAAYGMDLMDVRSFPIEGPADSHAWNILGVARRR